MRLRKNLSFSTPELQPVSDLLVRSAARYGYGEVTSSLVSLSASSFLGGEVIDWLDLSCRGKRGSGATSYFYSVFQREFVKESSVRAL